MRKHTIISLLAMICCMGILLSGCQLVSRITGDSNQQDEPQTTTLSDKDIEMIADTLSAEITDRGVENIVAHLNNLQTGSLDNVKLILEDDQKKLDITTKAGREFAVLINNNYHVEAIMDVQKGEWVVKSEK